MTRNLMGGLGSSSVIQEPPPSRKLLKEQRKKRRKEVKHKKSSENSRSFYSTLNWFWKKTNRTLMKHIWIKISKYQKVREKKEIESIDNKWLNLISQRKV